MYYVVLVNLVGCCAQFTRESECRAAHPGCETRLCGCQGPSLPHCPTLPCGQKQPEEDREGPEAGAEAEAMEGAAHWSAYTAHADMPRDVTAQSEMVASPSVRARETLQTQPGHSGGGSSSGRLLGLAPTVSEMSAAVLVLPYSSYLVYVCACFSGYTPGSRRCPRRPQECWLP